MSASSRTSPFCLKFCYTENLSSFCGPLGSSPFGSWWLFWHMSSLSVFPLLTLPSWPSHWPLNISSSSHLRAFVHALPVSRKHFPLVFLWFTASLQSSPSPREPLHAHPGSCYEIVSGSRLSAHVSPLDRNPGCRGFVWLRAVFSVCCRYSNSILWVHS